MRILLSVFAFAPNQGSELGIGWRYACHLARRHEVHVVTDESRRAGVEAYGRLPDGVVVHYYRPKLLRAIPLNSKTAQVIYGLWQRSLLGFAQQLHRKHPFDRCWHLTYGVFRQPSRLWRLGIPLTFGPVGGAERSPMRLMCGMSFGQCLREIGRSLANRCAWIDPELHRMYKHANVVIAKTSDTLSVLPLSARSRAAVLLEVGGYRSEGISQPRSTEVGSLNVLYAGRLLGLKGLHIALPAFARYLAQGGQGTFTLVGDGPEKKNLARLAERLGIERSIRFIPNMPQNELFATYRESDVLLFPSLHDSSGNVVIEALSYGLPVICLDLGGPKEMVNSTCGVVIGTLGKSVERLADDIASVLLTLSSDSERRQALQSGAIARAEEQLWERQIERVVAVAIPEAEFRCA